VQGYLRTLLSPDVGLTPAEEHEFLAGADRNAERLKRLIEDLLFAARIEGSGPLVSTEPIGIAGLLERVVADAGAGRERVILAVPEMLPLIESSDEDVYRIVSNLVDNALKYSPIESSVTVSAHSDQGGVTIRVRDSGPGIREEERGQIFERFYQVDQSTTRRVGGAGMGLYICRRAVERLGGRVWLDRSGEMGSVFAVWLPIDPPRELAAEPPALVAAPA
jgi:signal transduction histidine kinase